ncbi:GDP-mannose 4,6-dehydratase [Ectopseudomonas oleovorans]|uniref:GDP-mannose 4,6-dehydratase n=1 Tax=Ectopseudomonas oleovorans TaxID=301 RepID=UPI000CF0C1D6|nr:GDP-mannose 4,6-dehydratase [Pseudomonas oleovorans]PPV34367.1 GDP-6-deoxy-D-lyxo-4-hexulose reductase [Pseudomonas oleovorans]
MQRTLVTGANGFVGQQLCQTLQQAGQHVIALTTGAASTSLAAGQHLRCDIRDADALHEAVAVARPTHVIHLAAISHVPTSFANPPLTWQTNVMGSVNLMEAVRAQAPTAFTLFVSSSEVYGGSFRHGQALDEQAPCQPMNPYAASKLAGEVAVAEYFRQGMRGLIARPFNHIGERQSADFVTASFARQIALIEAGLQPPVLQVGNLQAQRDFLDVQDVCNAYLQLLGLADDAGQARCFNIASGQPRSIHSILETLLSLSAVPISVEQDPARLRPSDIPLAIGDNRAIRQATGWQPLIPLQDTLHRLLAFWRAQAAR